MATYSFYLISWALMSRLHIEPITFIARLFVEGGTFEDGSEYEAVMTIQKAKHIGYLMGCHGHMDVNLYKQMMRQLKELGITEVHWLRGDDETVKELM
jgi:hypothetical protein